MQGGGIESSDELLDEVSPERKAGGADGHRLRVSAESGTDHDRRTSELTPIPESPTNCLDVLAVGKIGHIWALHSLVSRSHFDAVSSIVPAAQDSRTRYDVQLPSN